MLCISEFYLRNFGTELDNLGCESNIFSWKEGRVMMSYFLIKKNHCRGSTEFFMSAYSMILPKLWDEMAFTVRGK
jgi:hypothetical protein